MSSPAQLLIPSSWILHLSSWQFAFYIWLHLQIELVRRPWRHQDLPRIPCLWAPFVPVSFVTFQFLLVSFSPSVFTFLRSLLLPRITLHAWLPLPSASSSKSLWSLARCLSLPLARRLRLRHSPQTNSSECFSARSPLSSFHFPRALR